jgi:hypothetical protein
MSGAKLQRTNLRAQTVFLGGAEAQCRTHPASSEAPPSQAKLPRTQALGTKRGARDGLGPDLAGGFYYSLQLAPLVFFAQQVAFGN